MKRTLVVVAVVVGFAFATAASAATLSVLSDKTTYNSGDTITLTVTGNTQGGTAYGIFGVLLYNKTPAGGQGTVTALSQGPQTLENSGWLKQTLNTGTTGGVLWQDAFNQVGGTSATPATLAQPSAFSTVKLIAGAAGLINVDWDLTGLAHGDPLRFFCAEGTANNSGGQCGPGAPPYPLSASGTSFNIIPEPATAALIGLGLLGLVVGGRRRS